METTKIGFIGLGVMGAPMATHLANAGYVLTLHDIDERAVQTLAGTLRGAAVAADPREVAERSDS